MSGGGAQQGQAGGMQQPLGGGMGQAAQGGFGSSALTFGNIAPPVGATNPQNVSNNLQQFQSSLMGSPMQGGMQQQLPPQMQPQMSALLQGGMQQPLVSLPPPGSGFGMGQNLQGRMQQPLVSLSAPIQAPNGNFGVPGGMGGGLPAQVQQPALIPFNQWVQSQNQDPNVPAMTTQQLQNKYVQEMGFGTGQNLSPFNRPQVQMPFGGMPIQGGMPMQAVQTGMPRPPVGAVPPNYLDYLQGLQNSGQSLMGDINAGQPGIPSTQGGLGSLGPMRSTPMPAAPTPPQVQTQTAPTRPEPRREFRTTNLADRQARIQGAQDQMNRMRSMGVGGARDYLSQIMGRR